MWELKCQSPSHVHPQLSHNLFIANRQPINIFGVKTELNVKQIIKIDDESNEHKVSE